MTGPPASPAPPARVRTLLFTDVEAHSAMWEADPGAMAAVIEQHDGLLRTAVEGAGGTVVKYGGDGVMAVFQEPGDGVAAAAAGQRAVTDASWALGPLRVRMGLHVGPAYERDGDWFGPTVTLAARLCDAAHGGQVVASDAVAHLARDWTWRELGEHRFRGIARPELVHQLVLVGEARAFPALRHVESGADRLPEPPSSFVGRDDELAEVVDACRAHRLVTLTAIGGGGKTRLALEAGHRLVGSFPDGADFVDLAAVGDPAQVGAALSAALRLDREGDPTPAIDRVVAHCRTRHLLLVVDNCEHLLDGVAEAVERILGGGPLAHILATSREPLHLSGECVVQVPSMSAETAAELFRDRAVTADDDAAVAEICARLDGIPLAVELAAARTSHLTPREIAARLSDRFRLLTGGNRRLQRQQTLQATLDWTHALLTDAEQALLRRLAVFAGWFRLPRVEALYADEPEEPLDLLGRLVELSMVLHDPVGGRYRLLETVRLYAELRLLDAGEAEAWRARHRDVLLATLSALPLEATTHIGEVSAGLTEEHADLRAALRWSMDQGEWGAAGELAHRLPAVTTLAGGDRLTPVLLRILEHLDGDSELAFRCMLAVLVSLSNEVEREVPNGEAPPAYSRDEAASWLRSAADVARGRPDDLATFVLAVAGLLQFGVGSGFDDAELHAEAMASLAEAEGRIPPGETNLWTSHALGMAGLVRTRVNDLDDGLPLLRRASGVDGGFKNHDYLGLYALYLLATGEEEALVLARQGLRHSAYGFGRVAALATVVLAEADTGNLDGAREELAGGLADLDRSGLGVRANLVMAAAAVARCGGEPARAARWLGAAGAVGPQKGPHGHMLLHWQLKELEGSLPADDIARAQSEGLALGADGACAEVAAWCRSG